MASDTNPYASPSEETKRPPPRSALTGVGPYFAIHITCVLIATPVRMFGERSLPSVLMVLITITAILILPFFGVSALLFVSGFHRLDGRRVGLALLDVLLGVIHMALIQPLVQ